MNGHPSSVLTAVFKANGGRAENMGQPPLYPWSDGRGTPDPDTGRLG